MTPGYPMPLDSPDAGSVRMIMEAQARSMYRGEYSMFARLRRSGIDPAEYVNFYSLRSFGKMKTGHLVSQDVSKAVTLVGLTNSGLDLYPRQSMLYPFAVRSH